MTTVAVMGGICLQAQFSCMLPPRQFPGSYLWGGYLSHRVSISRQMEILYNLCLCIAESLVPQVFPVNSKLEEASQC